MKKILVLVANYPDIKGGISLMYVHTRNKYYIQHSIDVTVLNFSTKTNYEIDGIKVISLESYKKTEKVFDVIVLHAANLKNHYRFLIKYDLKFKHMIFFFHGHEVLIMNEVYPKPYDYMKKDSKFRTMVQKYYDKLKLSIWRKYFEKNAYKSDFIFVSNWLFDKFQKYINLSKDNLHNHVHIIYNSVGSIFEKYSYNYEKKKEYDFITIRNPIDNSKYCIDLVDELARKNPKLSFLVIGRGRFYEVHPIPDNVIWIDRFLSHEEIMEYIEKSRCGLLLTREDTQGVMTCELAVYGIPVITSNIEVCQEICLDLDNIELIDNDISKVDIENIFNKLLNGIPYKKSDKFSYKNTVKVEETLISEIRGYFDS